MLSHQQQQVSASTRFRFQQEGRKDLAAFLEFKKEFQNAVDEYQIQQLKLIYQHGVLGHNSKFQTVVLDRIGQLKMAEINKVVDDDMFYAYLCQRVLTLSEQIVKEKQQIIWIIDLSGKIMQLASKRIYALLDKLIPNLQAFFPNLLSKIYFINTPMLFDTIWNKLNNKISQKTANKVIFLTDQLEELYADVDITLLPECLGGERSDESVFFSQEAKNSQQLDLREEEDEPQQQFDMSSLKEALSGLKIAGNNNPSVASTPLNTEADDYKKK